MVKAFIVLTPQFLSHDPDQLTKELQEHVKSVTASYKYPRKVSEGRGSVPFPCSAAQVWQGGRVTLKPQMEGAFFSAEEAIGLGGGVQPNESHGTSILGQNPQNMLAGKPEVLNQTGAHSFPRGYLKSFKMGKRHLNQQLPNSF